MGDGARMGPGKYVRTAEIRARIVQAAARKSDASFWTKATPEPNTGCWLWTGREDRDGYARLKWRGRSARASRVAWELVNGPIPGDLQVLHHCDNRACVYADRDPRKSHLFLGTTQDNTADMVTKGRQARGDRSGRVTHPETTARGERAGRAKLTEEAVRDIRQRHAAGARAVALAAEYGVCKNSIWNAISKLWRHVA